MNKSTVIVNGVLIPRIEVSGKYWYFANAVAKAGGYYGHSFSGNLSKRLSSDSWADVGPKRYVTLKGIRQFSSRAKTRKRVALAEVIRCLSTLEHSTTAGPKVTSGPVQNNTPAACVRPEPPPITETKATDNGGSKPVRREDDPSNIAEDVVFQLMNLRVRRNKDLCQIGALQKELEDAEAVVSNLRAEIRSLEGEVKAVEAKALTLFSS